MPKPLASLSLDLDNKWSYQKIHGDAGWESFPSYLDVVVPCVLEALDARGLRITVFVVGQDAALEQNRKPLEAIAAAGHELGNHSFSHEPWLHLYSDDELERDLATAEEHIERVTGQRPIGFRGPGYSLTRPTLRILARRGYRYDATTLPTFLGPLVRAHYLLKSRLGGAERRRRAGLFGRFSDGRRPITPYLWRVEGGTLLEIPVTTMPGLRVPIHLSYVLYLASFAARLGLSYFRTALAVCRRNGTSPSILLHPLDFLGGDEVRELAFFPGMGMSGAAKRRVVEECLAILCRDFRVLPMASHADELLRGGGLPVVEPVFPGAETAR